MNEVKKVIGSLVAMGYDIRNIALAGGCLRDAYFEPSKKPKDIDMVLVNSRIECFDEFLLPAGWHHVHTFDSDYGGEVKSADFDKRISHVVKIENGAGLQIDLILAVPEYVTCEQFVSDFDFNLNQFMTTASSLIVNNGTSRFIGPSFGTLIETQGTEVHPARRARMIALAHGYGWDISSFQGNLLKE